MSYCKHKVWVGHVCQACENEKRSSSLAQAPGSEGWYHCDRALMPKLGTVVEAQDGTHVFWGGVNWWRADEWKTHMVKKYRYLPNAAGEPQPRKPRT